MNPTFKVKIFYDDREYDEYVIDASTKLVAEKHAVANFKRKHNIKGGHIVAHAHVLGSEPPIVQKIKFFPSGMKPNGRPNFRIKVEKERIQLREFRYTIWALWKLPGGHGSIFTKVTAHDEHDAIMKGKRALASEIRKKKLKISEWTYHKEEAV